MSSSLVGGPYGPAEAMPEGLRDSLREHLTAAVREMEQQVREQVPEYARVTGSRYGRQVQRTIDLTVTHYVDSLGEPASDANALIELYTKVGAHEAREGRSLDHLQTAIRLSGQIACRRFIKDAYRLNWPRDTLGMLTDSLFALLSKVADAAAQGYANEQGRIATATERQRLRLRELLVSDPPASHEAIAELARSADWVLPQNIALVALAPGTSSNQRIMPPSILTGWDRPDPFLVVPDPERPGQKRFLAGLTGGLTAAIGPTVPVARGAASLRWARKAVALIEKGVLPRDELVYCVDHLATLAASAADELIDAAAATGLAALRALPGHRRQPLLETLLTYLQYGNNAVITAGRLRIHEQTVRYRLRRISEITDGLLPSEHSKLDTMLMLNWMLRSAPLDVEAAADPRPAPPPARTGTSQARTADH